MSNATIGGIAIGIIIFFILLPVWRWMCGYVFKTSDIVKLLKEINKNS